MSRTRQLVTQQQRRCLRLVAEGKSREEIAAELGIKASTVQSHLNAVYERFEVPNAAAAIAECYERGVFQVGAA